MAKDDPRALALDLLLGVLEARRSLADQEPALDAAPEARARAGRLVRATLRALGPADAVLKPLVRRRPAPEVQAILRLAVVEMLGEGGAPHGVVNAAVAMTRRRSPRAAGMVNAVLRRVAEIPPADFAALPPARLPGWLRGRLSAAYGNARVARMETVFAAPPPLDLTLAGREDPVAWADALGAERLPTGSLRRAAGGQVSGWPGFEQGTWWVQDAAAALPARILAARPCERVLDLCAAPGGKTLQLADAGAEVVALDISDARLARLRENLTRTGLSAEIAVADALDWSPDAPFDAVLLDAPCSATGTIRRHPDLPFVRQAADVKALAALQARLIDRATGWLRPGGRMVFCTCSLLPEEGEAQLAAALARHPGLRPLPQAVAALPGLEADWQAGPGALRITPESWTPRGGIDGFFIAALERVQESHG